MREQPNPTPPQPSNRAARRGRTSTAQMPATARYRGSPASARPAQGRRVIPVRRTG